MVELKKKPTKDTSTTETTTTPAAPEVVNTIVTTPQNMMTALHKVSNFAKWKASYDEHDSMRLANGIHSYVIGRGVQDTNMVLVAVKADDMAKAKAFAKDRQPEKSNAKRWCYRHTYFCLCYDGMAGHSYAWSRCNKIKNYV